jgi:hypothetical protein
LRHAGGESTGSLVRRDLQPVSNVRDQRKAASATRQSKESQRKMARANGAAESRGALET